MTPIDLDKIKEAAGKATPGSLAWLESRIMPEPNSGCWIWMGTLTPSGYGSFTLNRRGVRAHRAVFEAHKGQIPPGLVLDHLCRNRCCVNPDHLEPVTTKINCQRGVGPTALNYHKTLCYRGHELTAGNLLPSKEGYRLCATCARERYRQYKIRKRNAVGGQTWAEWCADKERQAEARKKSVPARRRNRAALHPFSHINGEQP